MSISFNFPILRSLNSLQVHVQLSAKEVAIAKIAFAILVAVIALYIRYKLDDWRQRVTVIDIKGFSSSTHMRNLNGIYEKVLFNGLWASHAEAGGMFLQGRLNGNGKIHFPAGVVIEEEGIFEKGWLVNGRMTYRDGKVEEGSFKDGRLNGMGKRIFLTGFIEKGIFNKGQFIPSPRNKGTFQLRESPPVQT